jgi:hypothetical protein
MTKKPKAPKHFSSELREWYEYYVGEFSMDPADQCILEMMGDSWREYQGLRLELAKAKIYTYIDRHGSPKPMPQLAAMNTLEITYTRLRRKLNLPIDDPDDVRLPRGNGRMA